MELGFTKLLESRAKQKSDMKRTSIEMMNEKEMNALGQFRVVTNDLRGAFGR